MKIQDPGAPAKVGVLTYIFKQKTRAGNRTGRNINNCRYSVQKSQQRDNAGNSVLSLHDGMARDVTYRGRNDIWRLNDFSMNLIPPTVLNRARRRDHSRE